MSKINAKQKGNRGERELVHILDARFGEGRFRRTPSSGAITGGSNRAISENLDLESKLTLASDIIAPIDFRFVIEHKAYEAASFWDLFNPGAELNKWLQQVEDDSEFVNRESMLVCKYNRHERICYIKDNIEELQRFVYQGWSCYVLADLLEKTPDDFWFIGDTDESTRLSNRVSNR